LDVDRKLVERDNWRSAMWVLLVGAVAGLIVSRLDAPIRKLISVALPVATLVGQMVMIELRLLHSISRPVAYMTVFVCICFSGYGSTHPDRHTRFSAMFCLFVEALFLVAISI
jgi:hypothetical protein